MKYKTCYFHIVLQLLLLVSLSMTGCGGDRSALLQQDTLSGGSNPQAASGPESELAMSAKLAQPVVAVPFDERQVPAVDKLPANLPMVDALATSAARGVKTTSYFEGSEVGGDMAYHLVVFNPQSSATVGDETLDFYPHFVDTTEYAYRMWEWDLSTYSGPSTLTFDWQLRPSGTAEYWIGLANRISQRWDWFAAPANDLLVLPSFDPYKDANGHIIVNVLVLASSGVEQVPAGSLYMIVIGTLNKYAVGGFRYLPQHGSSLPPRLVTIANMPPSVDYEPILPPCGNQGGTGTCTYWATMGALDMELRMAYGPYTAPGFPLPLEPSVKYAFVESLYLKNFEFSPGSIGNVTEFLYNYGVPSAQEAPWDWPSETFWDRNWSAPAQEHANLLDVENYWNFDMATGNTGDEFLSTIKTMVARHQRAVVLGLNLNLFQSWTFTREHPYLFDLDAGFFFIQGHALCVVGYDDSISALKVRNSWTKEGDPLTGHWWVSYANFDEAHFRRSIGGAIALVEDYNPQAAEAYFSYTLPNQPAAHLWASNGIYPGFVSLYWDHVAGAVSYNIYRDSTLNVYMQCPVGTPPPEYLHILDTNPTPGSVNTYWVQAVYPDHQGPLTRPVYGWANML